MSRFFVAAPTALGLIFAAGRAPLVLPPRLVAVDELVEVGAADRLLLEREMHVGAQVVDPQLVGPRLGAALFLLEEQHVGLHSRRVPNAGGQPQQRVHAALTQQVAA